MRVLILPTLFLSIVFFGLFVAPHPKRITLQPGYIVVSPEQIKAVQARLAAAGETIKYQSEQIEWLKVRADQVCRGVSDT